MRWISYSVPVALVGASVAVWQMDSQPFNDLLHRSQAPPAAKRSPNLSRRTIFAAGVVEGSRRQAPLRFEISGRLKRLEVGEGARVRKGEPLARLDDAVLQQRFIEAKSKLHLARAERSRLINGSSAEARKLARVEAELASVRVDQHKSELERASKAYAQGALTIDDYEKLQYQLKIARAERNRALARVAEVEAKVRSDDLKIADSKVALAANEVDQADVMLKKTILRAPADGIVLRIDAEPGEMLGPESTSRIITFVDDSVIQVRAYVEELDALGLHIGQRTQVIADGLPNKRYTGTISWIAPSMQSKTVLHQRPGEHVDVKVREVLIRIDGPENLVIGLPVEVFIDRPSKTPARKKTQKTESSAQPKQPLVSTNAAKPIPIGEGR